MIGKKLTKIFEVTLNSTSPAQDQVHQGPIMTRATFPSASVISNLETEKNFSQFSSFYVNESENLVLTWV